MTFPSLLQLPRDAETDRSTQTKALRSLTLALTAVTFLFLVSCFVSIAVNSLSMGVMAVLWLAVFLVGRRWPVVRTPLDFYLLGFLLVQILSTVFSINPLQSLLFSKRLLLLLLVYFFASAVTTEKSAKGVVGVLLGTAGLVAVIGVAKMIFERPEQIGRLGIFQFYMTTSELMTIAALLVFPFVIHPKTPPRMRLLAALCFLAALISLWGTVTRGAYLAAAFGLAFAAIVREKRMLLVLALLVAAVFIFSPPYVINRVDSIVDMHHPENESRLVLWRAGLAIFLDHPVLGCGDIDYGSTLYRYTPPGFPHQWGHFHNTYIQVLANYGILGFVVVMALFVKMVAAEWKVYRRTRDDWFKGSFVLGSLSALLGFFVNGLTEWSFGDQEVVTLIWVSVGIVFALDRLSIHDTTGLTTD